MQKITPFLWFDKEAKKEIDKLWKEFSKDGTVTQAMLGMKKLDIAKLRRAAGG